VAAFESACDEACQCGQEASQHAHRATTYTPRSTRGLPHCWTGLLSGDAISRVACQADEITDVGRHMLQVREHLARFADGCRSDLNAPRRLIAGADLAEDHTAAAAETSAAPLRHLRWRRTATRPPGAGRHSVGDNQQIAEHAEGEQDHRRAIPAEPSRLSRQTPQARTALC